MNKDKTLDFIVIGSQKAGTSSLAAYLNESQDVYIPPEKELPWFLNTEEPNSWDEFIDTYFRQAVPNQLIGTSTPQYMMYIEAFQRISERSPNTKMIAILRDPISRLVSHYDMAYRFGVEDRTLNDVVREQLSDVPRLRKTPYNDKTGKYLIAGEYGRIFTEFLKYFNRGQLLVLDFEELKSDTQSAVDHVSNFLDIQTFACKNINVKRMPGGNVRRINIDHDNIIGKLTRFGKLIGLNSLTPKSVKRIPGLLSSWIDENNVEPGTKSSACQIDQDLLHLLKQHYSKDLREFSKLNLLPNAAWLSDYDL